MLINALLLVLAVVVVFAGGAVYGATHSIRVGMPLNWLHQKIHSAIDAVHPTSRRQRNKNRRMKATRG